MRAKLSFANVTSVLALFVALGGTGYAAGVFADHARFADNAGSVDNLSASRSPTPGKLLALDHSGKFPGAAIPPPGVVERSAEGTLFAAAYCQQGEIVTGGGGFAAGSGLIVSSIPQRGARRNLVGWAVRGSAPGSVVTAKVLCARTVSGNSHINSHI